MTDHTLHRWSKLHGRLTGLRDRETERIITSTIATVDGRRITTESGSVYVLGDPDPDYLAHLKEEGRRYDPEHPIPQPRSVETKPSRLRAFLHWMLS